MNEYNQSKHKFKSDNAVLMMYDMIYYLLPVMNNDNEYVIALWCVR